MQIVREKYAPLPKLERVYLLIYLHARICRARIKSDGNISKGDEQNGY